MNNKIKIAAAIIVACIIIAGTIITFTLGLNFGLIYSANKQVTISIGKEFNTDDIKNIVKEVTNKDNMIIEKVEIYKDIVSIKLDNITDEELEQINAKINEKYEIENNVDNLVIIENANVRGKDLIKPYIYPVALSIVLITIYLAAYMLVKAKMGYKLNILQKVSEFIISIVIVEALFLSLIAIVRIPVNRLTIPIGLVLYVITTVIYMNRLENKYKKIENK